MKGPRGQSISSEHQESYFSGAQVKMLMKAIRILAFLLPIGLFAQNSLQVEVDGVDSSEGSIHVAIYADKSAFLNAEGVYRTDSVRARKGKTVIHLDDLPAGAYALAIFHDRNDNKLLDTNWIGIPKEPVGFSNARMRRFGPPSFEDCLVHLYTDAAIAIRLQ